MNLFPSKRSSQITPYKTLVDEVLGELPFSPFSFKRLIERVAAMRKRPIQVVAWAMPDVTLYGLWLTSPSQEFIFFERETAVVHQELIILHELSHILLGHTTLDITNGTATAFLQNALMRSEIANLHLTAQERDAEGLAKALQLEIIKRAGLQALTAQIATSPEWEVLLTHLGIAK